MLNKNLVTFLDGAQRTIIGEVNEDSSNSPILLVSNPVVVNIVPQADQMGKPTGQMALQLLPVYFREFQGEKKNPAVFNYKKAQITMIEFEGGFDFRLYGQYENIFNPKAPTNTAPGAVPASPPPSAPPVLNLFDDPKE